MRGLWRAMVCAGSNWWMTDRLSRISEGTQGATAFRQENAGRSGGCDWTKMWSLKLKSESHRTWTVALATWFGVAALVACGPDFPNTLLEGGDGALLMAPVADFIRCSSREKSATGAMSSAPSPPSSRVLGKSGPQATKAATPNHVASATVQVLWLSDFNLRLHIFVQSQPPDLPAFSWRKAVAPWVPSEMRDSRSVIHQFEPAQTIARHKPRIVPPHFDHGEGNAVSFTVGHQADFQQRWLRTTRFRAQI